ncbi:MAG: tetratricopeptide repeat protein [Bacteroidales bacterium]|nr:tetratricopeptide repeat protein [Bacteroidales bacterium]
MKKNKDRKFHNKQSSQNNLTKKLSNEKKINYLPYYIIIFVVAFLAYANTLTHGYVLDDYSVIKENYVVKKGFEGIPTILKTGYRFGYWNSPDNLYRPLSLIMFAVEWQLFPDKPFVSHLMNVILFALLCVFLFKWLLIFLKDYSIHFAFIAVLLYALHPIHTEVVANIKSRDEILAFLFAIITMILFVRYHHTSKWYWLVSALFSFLLALLSKESAITFLAIIPLSFYFFKIIPNQRNVFITVLMLVPVLLFFAMRHRAIGHQLHLDETSMIDNLLVAAPDFISRYATAIKILGLYLWKLVVPYPLACDYSYNQIPIVGLTNIYFIISFIVHLLLFTLAIYWFKKRHLLSFLILFYFISMSINSNLLILIGTSFGERLLFVPSFAYTTFISFVLIKFSKHTILPNSILSAYKVIFSKPVFLSLIILVPYLFLTISRNKDWKSSLSLYEADIRKSPNSAHMNYYYGLELMKERAMKDGKVVNPSYLDSAIFYFTKAKQIIPTYADAYDQIGLAYFRKNDWDKALAYYDTCLTLAPGKPITYSNMGVIYFQRQQYDKALELYEKVVRYDPKFADGWFNLGSTYGTLGRFNDAIYAFKKCLEFNPEKAEAYYFLGITYQNLKDETNAQFYLNKAYELNPNLKKP